jgi:SAM-dependent methyltransferase
MHDTALHIGSLAMNIYADLTSASILEIGSQAVNGSLRKYALPTTKYLGLDLEEGEGVDQVVAVGEPLPVEDGAYDLVIASSVFEHDPCFWMTFLEMCRATREGGYIYVNAPSNGMVHRYPQDNWRFYPDSGLALQRWAQSQGQHVTLLESFIAERDADIWNDFVAVFRKGRITRTLPATFIHEHVPSVNVITWRSDTMLRPRDEPQDALLLREASERATALSAELAASHQQLRTAEENLKAYEGQAAELAETRDNLATRESELRQRQEEIEQTRAELTGSKKEVDRLQDQLDRTSAAFHDVTQRSEALQEEVDRLREQIGALRRSEAQAKQQGRQAEQEAAQGREKVAGELRRSKTQIDELTRQANELKIEQGDRFRELGMMASLLKQQEERGRDLSDHVVWTAAVHQCLQSQPRWWHLMPLPWRAKREQRRLRRAGLFDHEAYNQLYPDVPAAGLDALEHYLRHGVHEGRMRHF